MNYFRALIANMLKYCLIFLFTLSLTKVCYAAPQNEAEKNFKHSYLSCSIISSEHLTALQLYQRGLPRDVAIKSLPRITRAAKKRVKYVYDLAKKIGKKMREELILKANYQNSKFYMNNISANDKYRIEKAYLIYKHSKLTPTQFFLENPKQPIVPDLPIFEIMWDTQELRQRIKLRTKQMINEGVIDEVIHLEKKYTRLPNCMSSIGIIETLEYLDGKLTRDELEEKISTNTARLAKRQRSFNRSQFNDKQTKNIITSLNSDILKYFSI